MDKRVSINNPIILIIYYMLKISISSNVVSFSACAYQSMCPDVLVKHNQ